MLLLLYLLSCHLAFFGGFFLLIWIFPSIDDKTKKTSKRVDVHKTGDEMRHAQTVFGDTHKTGPSSMVGIRFRLERKGKWVCYIRTVSIFSSSSASSQAEGITEFFFPRRRKVKVDAYAPGQDDSSTKEESLFFLLSSLYIKEISIRNSERAEMIIISGTDQNIRCRIHM